MNLTEYCMENKAEYLLKEWDGERNKEVLPDALDAASHKKVWWRCAAGHEWQAAVKDRCLRETGCPYCAGKKAFHGFNDLLTLAPEIAAEWNDEKNDGLLPQDMTVGAEKKVWWMCEKGHEWQATVENRARKGNACPYCSGKRAWPGYNDLQTLYPKLAREWHSALNRDIKPDRVRPGSGKKVWWMCGEGHIWEARIFSRTSKKKPGCPYCAGNRKRGKEKKETNYV